MEKSINKYGSMDWKEKYVKSIRDNIRIDENQVMGYVQELVDKLDIMIEKEGLKKEVKLDFNKNLVYFPNGIIVSINVVGNCNTVRFEKFIKRGMTPQETDQIVDIVLHEAIYKVRYYGNQDTKFDVTDIDYDLIDDIFKYLLS